MRYNCKIPWMFMVLLLGCVACGNEGSNSIEWERNGSVFGIKDPEWIYCEHPDKLFTRCYRVITRWRPDKPTGEKTNRANVGTVSEWKQLEERISGELWDPEWGRAYLGHNYLVEYRGRMYFQVFDFGAVYEGSDKKFFGMRILHVIRTACADKLGIPAFFDTKAGEIVFYKPFRKFDLIPDGSCLYEGNTKWCVGKGSEIRNVSSNPCQARLELREVLNKNLQIPPSRMSPSTRRAMSSPNGSVQNLSQIRFWLAAPRPGLKR